MKEKCSVVECDRYVHGKGYCVRHYLQSKTPIGITISKKSKRDPNELVVVGDVCLVALVNNRGIRIETAVVDEEDIDLVQGVKWRLIGEKRYVHSWKLKQYLHQVITGLSGVDHIDGNPLNNRRSNLRQASASQNNMNKGKQSNNSAGYKGVTFDKRSGKFIAQICIAGKRKYLGCFDDPLLAALAYNNAAITLHGNFARINEI